MSEQSKSKLEIVQDRINQYDIRFPVATLAKEMKMNKGYVSGVLSGQKPVSDNFWETFNKKYPQKNTLNGAILDATAMLSPDTKQLYERWLADKEKTQQQFHATNQGLIELLKNKLEEIATNLMTSQHQIKEQLFVVGDGLKQQLEGIASGLAAKERDATKDISVSGQKKGVHGKSKDH